MNEKFTPVELVGAETSRTLSCAEGGILLGGGYEIRGVRVELDNAVAVRANRPTGANSWLLTVAQTSPAPPAPVWVSLYIYCLRRIDGSPIDVSSQAVRGPGVAWGTSPFGTRTAVTAAECPAGQTLSGGGFEVTVDAPEPRSPTGSSLYNSWILASEPESDRRSWRVEAALVFGPLPEVRAFANCVSDPGGVLKPVSADDVNAGPRNGLGDDFYEGAAPCGSDAIAAAGGFTYRTDVVVPHSLIATRAASELRGWHELGVFGAQPGDTSVLRIRPLCFEALAVSAPARADLVARLGDDPLSSTDCPNGARLCFTFTVLNAGTAASAATEAEITSPGTDAVRENVPHLAPNDSVQLTVGLGTGACPQDCSVAVKVDPDSVIAETDKTNNKVSWFAAG